MGASLAAVGMGFAASLGHVLWVIEAWTGITFTICAGVVAGLCLAATRRREPLTVAVVDNDGFGDDDTVPVREQCPWCDTRDCLDSTLCNCGEACGSWLCVVKEASNG